MSVKTSTLYQALADLARLQTEWLVRPTLSEDSATAGVAANVDAIFDPAKKAVAIIAACSAVLEITGPEAATSAEVLLDKKRDSLPAVLVEELDKARRGTCAPPSRLAVKAKWPGRGPNRVGVLSA